MGKQFLLLALLLGPIPSKQEVRIGNAGTAASIGLTLPKLVTYTRPEYTDEMGGIEFHYGPTRIP